MIQKKCSYFILNYLLLVFVGETDEEVQTSNTFTTSTLNSSNTSVLNNNNAKTTNNPNAITEIHVIFRCWLIYKNFCSQKVFSY